MPVGAQSAAGPNRWWKGYESAPLVRTPDGRHLRVYCMGVGQPAVVLESGLGDGAWSWRMVQAAMAKDTRVCSYDRAGLGASDEANGPRDVDAMGSDLAVVVKAAGGGTPVVLAGHSLGGAIVRQFAYRYPERVAGIVMVDSASDHQIAQFNAINPLLVQPSPVPDPIRRCLDLTEKGPIAEGTADYQQCVGRRPRTCRRTSSISMFNMARARSIRAR
jgi:pimeloyl-ACP methyl ester carboxylesterase